MARLTGKVAVVTGGSAGIGKAAARLFLREGARVAIVGRNGDELEAAAAELGDVLPVAADVSKVDDLDRLRDVLQRAFGQLDVAFLNAGITGGARLEDIDEAFFDRIFAVNVKGVLFSAQRIAPLLTQGGSIIMTTSSADRIGAPDLAVYAASKAAVRSLVRTLAAELSDRGIRVNAVCAGPTDTDILRRAGLLPDQVRAVNDDMAARTILGRLARPEEVAAAALFLASDESSYMTGAEMTVDAGWTEVGRPWSGRPAS